jgi:acyl-CoA thioesterase FadM
MDHEIDKQDPRSKEGGQVKVGDTVWVKAKVAEVDNVSARLTTEVYGQSFWAANKEFFRTEIEVQGERATESGR